MVGVPKRCGNVGTSGDLSYALTWETTLETRLDMIRMSTRGGSAGVSRDLPYALTWRMALEARLGMVGVSKRSGDAGVSGLCFTRWNEKDVADKCL